MRVVKAILKGVGGLSLVCSLALSFAPATGNEQAALGIDAPRIAIVQRRLAIGLRDFAPASLHALLAQSAKIAEDQLADGLEQIITPTNNGAELAQATPPAATPPDTTASNTTPTNTGRSFRAGGALFVQAN